MPYTEYPQTIYDRPNNLLAVLGSWWSDSFAARDQVADIVRGKCRVESQTMLDLMETIAAISRETVPLFHTDNWYQLVLKCSDMNRADLLQAKYDTGLTYDAGYYYDAPLETDWYIFPLPVDVAALPVLVNRFTDPTLTWTEGVDYQVDPAAGVIRFRINPFTDARLTTRTLYVDGQPTDTEVVIWCFRGLFDWELTYKNFGHVLGTRMRSSAGYRAVVNAIYDAIVGGTTRLDILRALSAITGIPLVRESQEVVVEALYDRRGLLIVTDQHTYRYGPNVTATVNVGDVVYRGQSLTDAMAVYELNKGIVPPDLPGLVIGEGLLATCFYSGLLFENKDVAITVHTDDPSGFTKITWPLGGFPLDVSQFFDEVHARGVAAARLVDNCRDTETVSYPANTCDEVATTRRLGTLAHLLDRRVNKVGEPTAAHLPATINPLQFLIQNVLRNNAYIVRIKAAAIGQDGVGLQHVRLLQKVIPPHTAMIIVIDMAAPTETIYERIDDTDITFFTGAAPQEDTVNTVTALTPVARYVSGSYR